MDLIQSHDKIESNARNRQNNFTPYEIELLKQIIAEENKLKIIECKTTDKYSKQQKDKVWEEIRDEFSNDLNTNKRDIKSLKGFWKRYKLECRKNCNKKKSEIRATGGGPQPKDCDPIDQYIASYVHNVSPPVNQFDDDFEVQNRDEETQEFVDQELGNQEINNETIEKQENCLITIDTNASEYISETPSLKNKRKSYIKSSSLSDSKAKDIEREQWVELQREKHLLEMEILNLKKEKMKLGLRNYKMSYSLLKQNSVKSIKSKTIYAFF
jgi:hypothetical protein